MLTTLWRRGCAARYTSETAATGVKPQPPVVVT
jgi:hypothetical protein